jgi:DNA-3-methyladenine glycosylase I
LRGLAVVLLVIASAGSLARFVWRFEPAPDAIAVPQTASTSAEAIALSKALKKLGWKFVGPTTVYAFMQAMGLVNDHAHGCVVRNRAEAARSTLKLP